MIVVSVLYPSDPESKFDLVYYQNRHLPLCRDLLTPMGMQSLTFFRPIVTDPGAAFQLVAELRFTDLKTTNAALAAHGSSESYRARMFDFEALNKLIGTPEMLELGRRYSGEPALKREADRKR